MGKRFSRYEFALKSASAGEGGEVSGLNTNSPLGKYQQYRNGEVKPKYPRSEESKQISMKEIGIRPFSAPVSSNLIFLVSISERTQTASEVAGVIGKSNHIVDLTDLSTGGTRGFLPARTTIRKAKSGDGAPGKSKITGVDYQVLTDASWTIPYGQKTTATFDAEVRAEILTLIKDNKTLSASFRSEKA